MAKETSSFSHFCLALIYSFKFQSNRVFKTYCVRKHVNRNRFMACWYGGGGGRFFLRQSFEKVKGYFTRIYGHAKTFLVRRRHFTAVPVGNSPLCLNNSNFSKPRITLSVGTENKYCKYLNVRLKS